MPAIVGAFKVMPSERAESFMLETASPFLQIVRLKRLLAQAVLILVINYALATIKV